MHTHTNTTTTPGPSPADFDGSFADVLDAALQRFADRACTQFAGRTLSYREIDHASAQVAHALRRDGFETGMKAAVYALNSDTAFIATLGVVRAGGVWLPVNARNSVHDNVETLARFGCDALFFQPAFAAAADAVRMRCPALHSVVAIDGNVDVDGTAHTDLARWTGGAPHTPPRVALTGTDLVSIPTTGGTTGQPKGVMLSHRNFRALDHAIRSDCLQPDAAILCAAPMSHVGGRLALIALSSGARLVILDKVDPQGILSTVQAERITDLFLPPTAVYALLEQPNLASFDLSTLRSIGYGSAPMATPRLRDALQRLGPVMRGGFGQTECPMFITTMNPAEHFVDGQIAPDTRLRSVGRATCISRLAILDDQGKLLPSGQLGEIGVQGANVCEGYFDSPDETARIRSNGWHLTGDIGHLDEDGYLYIVDRKKDMVVTGGFNVYSAEVEGVLMSLPGVRAAAVIGVPSDRWGEEVKAIVQALPGVALDALELIAACKQRLGSVKAPKSVDFVTELPYTAVGKLDKKRVRAAYWAGQSRQI